MDKLHESSTSIARQALRWTLTLGEHPEPGLETRLTFADWLRRSPNHARLFHVASACYAVMIQLKPLPEDRVAAWRERGRRIIRVVTDGPAYTPIVDTLWRPASLAPRGAAPEAPSAKNSATRSRWFITFAAVTVMGVTLWGVLLALQSHRQWDVEEEIAAKELQLREQEHALRAAQVSAATLQAEIIATRAERDAVRADLRGARLRLASTERARRSERLRSREVTQTLTYETRRVTYTAPRTEPEQPLSPQSPECKLSNYMPALPAELGNEVWEPYTMQFVSRMKWYQIQSSLALERRPQSCDETARSG